MTRLSLSVAVGDYDRTRPLFDGTIQIDGVSPIRPDPQPGGDLLPRLPACRIRHLRAVAVQLHGEDGGRRLPYVGIPAFPSRAFRHTAIYVRTDRIKQPADLKGKTIGVPEYQLTANVWARALLEDEFGVKPSDINWVRGGMEQAGRLEKIPITLPADVRLADIPADKTLSAMLADGEIDGIIAPRTPSCFDWGHPHVGWLFPDPAAAAAEYFARTGIFPIMHLVGIRRTLAEQHPWLAASVLKAFEQAKWEALARLADTSATKITLPFVEEQLKKARQLMGQDFWSYGVASNRKTLDTFLRHHHAQGLSSRRVAVDELFHPATLEAFKV